jgi:hypothetical protein
MVGLILPDNNFSKDRLKRSIKLAKKYFKSNKVVLFAMEHSNKYFESIGIRAKILPHFQDVFDDNNFFKDFKGLIVLRDDNDKNSSFKWKLSVPVFKEFVFGIGGLRKVSGKFDNENKYKVFHKYSSDVVFFPYIILNRYNVFNDENSLGFRMREDFYKLKNRDKNHKVIAIFGGSSVYDITSIEPFSLKLEKLFRKNSYKVSVLNFGICGGCIMDEISAYNLFAYEIDPDIVISYSGANDFASGQIVEENYIRNHIIYPKFYSDMALKLSNKEANLFNVKNTPFQIIDSYQKRVYFFKRLVEKRGKKFIFVLQPYYFAKKLSIKEKENLKIFKKNNIGLNITERIINNMKIIYNKFNLDFEYLNMHEFFYQFNEEKTLFADIVHLLDEGSDIVADKLYYYLEKRIK